MAFDLSFSAQPESATPRAISHKLKNWALLAIRDSLGNVDGEVLQVRVPSRSVMVYVHRSVALALSVWNHSASWPSD